MAQRMATGVKIMENDLRLPPELSATHDWSNSVQETAQVSAAYSPTASGYTAPGMGYEVDDGDPVHIVVQAPSESPIIYHGHSPLELAAMAAGSPAHLNGNGSRKRKKAFPRKVVSVSSPAKQRRRFAEEVKQEVEDEGAEDEEEEEQQQQQQQFDDEFADWEVYSEDEDDDESSTETTDQDWTGQEENKHSRKGKRVNAVKRARGEKESAVDWANGATSESMMVKAVPQPKVSAAKRKATSAVSKSKARQDSAVLGECELPVCANLVVDGQPQAAASSSLPLVKGGNSSRASRSSQGGSDSSASGQPRRDPRKTQKAFQCPLCWRSYGSNKECHKHRLVHDSPKPHVCDVCGHRSRQKGNLDLHMRTHSGVKPHKCEVAGCHADFRFPGELATHTRKKHEERKEVCNACGDKFWDGGALRRHCLQKHSEEMREVLRVRCKVCKLWFGTRTLLLEHSCQQASEEWATLRCAICSVTFESFDSLNEHGCIDKQRRKESGRQ